MNIFILNTGRCGSTTFIQACQHILNYSAAHESNIHFTGIRRLQYPANHIEADNRLSWLLGRLDKVYGDTAYYVHLKREHASTAESFAKRNEFGIMKAYREGILMHPDNNPDSHDIADDYINTVESNIQCFLKDKTHTLDIQLETIKSDFSVFWEWIGAKGNLAEALNIWDTRYNAS